MRKFLPVLFLLMTASISFAQKTDAVETPTIDKAIETCITMSIAAQNNDTTAMHAICDTLKNLKICYFDKLICQDTNHDTISLKGHLVFDNLFTEKLMEGEDAYKHADSLMDRSKLRGQTSDGSILTKTCLVKAKGHTIYTFPSKGHQELAVVAESGGLVTMQIHVTNNRGLDVRYDDTKDVQQGRQYRKVAFDLPKNVSSIVEVKIINCSDKNISFAVISN